jgi:hypothetical protein
MAGALPFPFRFPAFLPAMVPLVPFANFPASLA